MPQAVERQNLAVSMKKTHLPRKICAVCGGAFVWRKKWRRNWDAVRYCSARCRRRKSSAP
ncbi:MAG: DUF2256 domain-containing protein [Saprospiraceae bacterium]|nr:DUF2256 domain-containing protein [Saprospiraceae bacterium]